MGPPHRLGVFNNNVSAVKRALLERYFLCEVDGIFHRPPVVQEKAFDTKLFREFRQGVIEDVKRLATVYSLLEVVNSYTGAKRKTYQAAYESLSRIAVNRKDSVLRPFTKFEKQAIDKACRIINPRSPRYNLVLGKYLKKSEKLFYNAINRMWGEHTPQTVVKGVNVVEAASTFRKKWDRFTDPVAIGLDAKKFDMHVSIPALEYEHSFYNGVFGKSELRRLLSWQLRNRGKAYCADGTVEFRMPGTRSSGDLNTSLGNCILMCSMIWVYCRLRGVDAELANNGDDCVVIMERRDEEKFGRGLKEWFMGVGFRMEVEPTVDVFEQIEFCQSSPVFDGKAWRMVRNVRTCLKKDPMCLLPLSSAKALQKWLWAVGTCGSALVPGIPVLRNFYKCFTRHGIPTRRRHLEHIFKSTSMMERVTGLEGDWEPTPASRASFYAAFGITPDYQVALEDYYDNLALTLELPQAGWEGEAEVNPPPFLQWL